MFKKKELVSILILAVLVTLGSALSVVKDPEEVLRCQWVLDCSPWNYGGLPLRWLKFGLYGGGVPVGIAYNVNWTSALLDLAFWFAIMVAGWWVVKKLKIKS